MNISGILPARGSSEPQAVATAKRAKGTQGRAMLKMIGVVGSGVSGGCRRGRVYACAQPSRPHSLRTLARLCTSQMSRLRSA